MMSKFAIKMVTVACLVAGSVSLLANGREVGLSSPTPEHVLGFSRNGTEFIFDVISHGCTRKEDFELQSSLFDKAADNTSTYSLVSIELIRTKDDRCRRTPTMTTIQFDTSDAQWNVAAVVVTNPVIALHRIKRAQ